MYKHMADKKIRVAILMGGISSEREVSLSTGRMIAENLDKGKYIVQIYDTKVDLLKLASDAKKIDVAFIALHGKYGEDGTIQGMLELFKVPYVGCGVLASALAMDKDMSKRALQAEGIAVPKGFLAEKEGGKSKDILERITKEVGFPCVVKPNDGGSSVGTSIAESPGALNKALKMAFEESKEILIEEYLKGTEISVPVLGNDKLKALPVIEICPKTKFFDYEAKYNAESCDEIVPARISEKLTAEAQELAIRSYRVLKCRGFSRIDMIIKNNKIYVLEINTIPGMTPESLLPKSAKAAGILFPKLLDKIMKLALE